MKSAKSSIFWFIKFIEEKKISSTQPSLKKTKYRAVTLTQRLNLRPQKYFMVLLPLLKSYLACVVIKRGAWNHNRHKFRSLKI